MNIHDVSEFPLVGANGANIPVNIFIFPVEDDDEKLFHYVDDPNTTEYKWCLRGDLFMPRKGFREGSFLVFGTNRNELVAYAQKYIRPLFENALAHIDALGEQDEQGESSFYYWEIPNDS